jgi:hypothetical protein
MSGTLVGQTVIGDLTRYMLGLRFEQDIDGARFIFLALAWP